MKKYILILLSVILLCGCSSKKSQSSEPVEDSAYLLNTVVSISIYDNTSDEDRKKLIQNSFTICSNYEKNFSKTISESDTSRINMSAGEPVEVSDNTVELLDSALKYSRLSEGAFDITIAPASNLWDFQSGKGMPPQKNELEEAVTHINYQNISINNNQVKLLDQKAEVDFGGIAKGFIADKIAAYLKEEGVQSAIINLGGNIMTVGGRPNGSDFNIGIQKPFETHSEILGSVSVKNKSVVTSGIYERFFRYDNKLYHHILNPETGLPIENNLLSVTIISDSSVDGDALSTACFVLGVEKGKALIESLEAVDAIFVTKDGQTHMTSGIGTEIKYQPKQD